MQSESVTSRKLGLNLEIKVVYVCVLRRELGLRESRTTENFVNLSSVGARPSIVVDFAHTLLNNLRTCTPLEKPGLYGPGVI